MSLLKLIIFINDLDGDAAATGGAPNAAGSGGNAAKELKPNSKCPVGPKGAPGWFEILSV